MRRSNQAIQKYKTTFIHSKFYLRLSLRLQQREAAHVLTKWNQAKRALACALQLEEVAKKIKQKNIEQIFLESRKIYIFRKISFSENCIFSCNSSFIPDNVCLSVGWSVSNRDMDESNALLLGFTYIFIGFPKLGQLHFK